MITLHLYAVNGEGETEHDRRTSVVSCRLKDAVRRISFGRCSLSGIIDTRFGGCLLPKRRETNGQRPK